LFEPEAFGKMNVSAEKGKEIKSQRAKELEELRSKGVAKSRREKLKNCKSNKEFDNLSRRTDFLNNL
jgi:hypothetical protein